MLAIAVAVASAIYLSFASIPIWAVRQIADVHAMWLLSGDSNEEPTSLELFSRKLIGEAVQQSLLAHFHSSVPRPPHLDDVEYAGEQLTRLRRLIINQSELKHNPASGPVALSGLAWCDMANGLGGRLLARDFEDVQLVGVRDPVWVGHSFGRFRSANHEGWLYFDLWTEEVVIFQVTNDRGVVYLYVGEPVGARIRWPGDIEIARKAHAIASNGFVHNKLQSTVGGYFLHRLANLARHGSTLPPEAMVVSLRQSQTASTAFSVSFYSPTTAVVTAYVRARIEHFIGDEREAAKFYRKAALLDGRRSVFGAASELFSARFSSASFEGAAVNDARLTRFR